MLMIKDDFHVDHTDTNIPNILYIQNIRPPQNTCQISLYQGLSCTIHELGGPPRAIP